MREARAQLRQHDLRIFRRMREAAKKEFDISDASNIVTTAKYSFMGCELRNFCRLPKIQLLYVTLNRCESLEWHESPRNQRFFRQ